MKMKLLNFLIAAATSVSFVACEYDNFEPPTSILSGSLMYEGAPVSVRNNGVELELWQDGYPLRSMIQVYINQEGKYSASLFDGDYKLVRKGNSPWLHQSADTLLVSVRGNTQFDVPVTPYFTIANSSFERNGNTVDARFTIERVVENSSVESVRLYLGKTLLTDQNQYDVVVEGSVADIVLGQPVTLSGEVPERLRNLDFIFARVGVKSSLTGEYNYSQVQRIALK